MSGGASTARAVADAAGAHTPGERHLFSEVSARYPALISSNATFAPRAGNTSTPYTNGAQVAPSVLIASARPKLTPEAFARRQRWLNSAPITRVGGPNATTARTASPAMAADMLAPSV